MWLAWFKVDVMAIISCLKGVGKGLGRLLEAVFLMERW